MNEKGLIRIVLILVGIILLLGAGFCWYYISSSRHIEKLGIEARELGVLVEDYSRSIDDLSGRNSILEDRYLDLDRRYRDLAHEVPSFIGGLGDLDQGLLSIERGTRDSEIRLRDDISVVSGLIAEIRERTKAASENEDDSMDANGDSSS